MSRKLAAEFFGTFWLVFGGCGSAVLAAAFPQLGIGFIGVAFAFGLTVLTMAFAVGGISGGHFNPAVTVGFWVTRKFSTFDTLVYWIAQCAGAISAAYLLRRLPFDAWSAVQLGTVNFYDPTASMRILDGLPAALGQLGARSVTDIVGSLG